MTGRPTTFAFSFALVILALSDASASRAAEIGVPIHMLVPTFACRDLSDMIRLGLRRLDGDKAGFLAFFNARQAEGACGALRDGTVALLQDSHDEQGLHLVCIKQENQPGCFWSISPVFAPL